MIIATGCQGEPNAGLDKLCSNMSKYIFLKKDDCVIFSSKTIPGNEKDLMYIYNKLAEMDVEVITAENYFTHVSGHYKKNDLLKMYSYVKPKMLIAVHGEPVHLMEQQRIAKENGILHTIKGKNVFLNILSLVGITLECECLDVGKDMLILSTCFDNFCISSATTNSSVNSLPIYLIVFRL